ncbi:conserved hypothetical protein [Leishmania infantum JPCM5]|uniref:Uncharacterized protein n=2 Tax=Leishmania infantum TaxID=5671 RepID=A4I798_LEIIN|nr:conserved hypothetical protein [Leishmania infantum JPCM5]CAC9521574.1 hypothetical_protein_-_conserved [Leishmania infantum]CAM70681.1 conserved hypothetical protein [Leishmania infantum JPCM5]SUZ44534.1 hypothetical_protein_-_conserved [Leishmania infantum]|eukprot:XP_001467617.1 conserved hypothetical protein [Leishmania infantum JPCM5]
MNALGNRCRSVIVLVNTSLYTSPLLDEGCGYHCGCVVVSSDLAPLARGIVRHAEHFCEENNISYRIVTISEKATEIGEMMTSAPAEEWLTSPLTLIDCTPAVDEEVRVASLLAWLYGAYSSAASREGSATEAPYTLVAVLDAARQVPCPPPITASSSAGGDTLAWLRPTPSYYSELMESVGSSADSCVVFPVHMYSRYPALRDCGLRERCTDGGATAPVPLAAWPNKCTLSALLRELAFKAGQLAKYGA